MEAVWHVTEGCLACEGNIVTMQVLAAARAIDASKAAGNDTGPLCGLPFAVKDNIDVVGYATVAGTPGLEGEHFLFNIVCCMQRFHTCS